MRIGYIGLGKMGRNMVGRLVQKGHRVHAYDPDPRARQAARREGARIAGTIAEMAGELPAPRTIWLMVPAFVKAAAGKPPRSPVDEVLRELSKHLSRGDMIIDGGNSPYRKTVVRAKRLAARGIRFLDAGISGGPAGARQGACVMVGGKRSDFKRFEELFRDIAVRDGFAYVGAAGAGHFVKMVHNGIEYGMMQAVAEGFAVMRRSRYRLPLTAIAELYGHGSVIESRLVAWLAQAYAEHGEELRAISGSVAHTGEGAWTVREAQKLRVPVPVIAAALAYRIRSARKPDYAGKVLSALRNQFGGHHATR